MRSGRENGCGMQYAVRRSGSAVGYCALSIQCGTRDEGDFHSGIAHFTEHTMFKGTARRSARAINGCLDRRGGELNAYTTKEEIVLHATVLKEDLGKAASLLFELATKATFPEAEVETERGVVIDELISYKDSPADDVYDRFEEALFAGHPLGRPILGTAASVRKITSGELRCFVRERFSPEKMAFTVVADIDESRMEKDVIRLIRKHFDGGTAAPYGDSTLLRDISPSASPFDRTIDKHNHEVNAVIGSTAPSLHERHERLSAVLLANILGGPASNSMLNSLLREKHGWVYGAECAYTQYRETGVAAITFGCDRPNLDNCLEAIDRLIGRLRTAPLPESSLKAARRQLLGQLAISADNGETQCLSMGKSLLAYGQVIPSEETRREIDALTSADIQEMACRIFDPGKLSRLIYL